ncbi:GGDEF domain-containing protein [Photobacterium sp. OFAV2-7]|uniref:GGDEF domain-containing protein n=1 Tax=Photobacterium sp. OFAV2-7 TaxID=2917748 RepID=UPI001EF730F5|nr:GGDEF domain-containing protein [Photobacterium sp. OFAV2-7]MCG7584924.1 GGDEF domain-containing protein [Photobacterium sp. OFAV2-7]
MSQYPLFEVNEKAISRQISERILFNGFIWIAAASLLLHTIVGYYLFQYGSPNPEGYYFYGYGVLGIVIGAVAFQASRQSRWRLLWWHLGGAVLSTSWISLAWTVIVVWDRAEAAEKILLIGFLAMMIGWYVKPSLTVVALVPVTGCYLCLSLLTPGSGLAEHVLSLLKFPLLFGIFFFTVRQFFLSAEARFIDKITLIRQLEVNSQFDELTRVRNRKAFNIQLESAIGNARRLAHPLSLVVIDIDFFKQYNDTLGHPAGDACLQKFAAILAAECQRSVDTVARIGGEEFALVLPGADEGQARLLLEKVLTSLSRAGIEHPASPVAPVVTASAGIARYMAGEDPDELYLRADQALYRAKQAGRDQIVIDSLSCREGHT